MNSPRVGLRACAAAVALCAFASRLLAAVPDFLPFQHYEEPAYPLILTTTSLNHGFATVAFVVDRGGRVEDAVTLEASHPSFGQAVIEAMRSWQIAPDASDAPRRREVVQFSFTREHAVTSLTHKDAAKALFSLSQDDAKPVRVVDWAALPIPPKRMVYVAPAYTAEARSKRIQGAVTVNFVVDESGTVHVPTIAKSPDPLLSAEVLSAVRKWRFAPPRLNGQPVNVQVEREFSFLAKN